MEDSIVAQVAKIAVTSKIFPCVFSASCVYIHEQVGCLPSSPGVRSVITPGHVPPVFG